MKLLSILFVLLAGTAWAGPCGPDRETDVPVLEDAKAAFLDADYRAFTTIAGAYFPDIEENFDNYFGQIQVVFPNGYVSCHTVLQRREEPGFFQDLVFYIPEGYDAPMALLLIAAEVDGEAKLIEFSYNTSISAVLEELK